MNKRQILLDLRNSKKLKGLKPCFVFLKQNFGKIYEGQQADFILSIREDTIYFQRLSFFFHSLKPNLDFEIDIKDFISYTFETKKMENVLCLFTRDRKFIEIHYYKGLPDTYSTEDNMSRIIKILEEKNIKELTNGEEGTNESRKGIN